MVFFRTRLRKILICQNFRKCESPTLKKDSWKMILDQELGKVNRQNILQKDTKFKIPDSILSMRKVLRTVA